MTLTAKKMSRAGRLRGLDWAAHWCNNRPRNDTRPPRRTRAANMRRRSQCAPTDRECRFQEQFSD